jgi:hypothetical protein
MVRCDGLCCKGHNIPPLARQTIYHGYLGEPKFHSLRRYLREQATSPVKVHKDPSKDLTEVDYTAHVLAKLFADDAFRSSSVGLTLFGNGSAPIRLAPDPKMLQNHSITAIR